jgi:hypothetical protein
MHCHEMWSQACDYSSRSPGPSSMTALDLRTCTHTNGQVTFARNHAEARSIAVTTTITMISTAAVEA